MPGDIEDYLAATQQQVSHPLRLYGLADGVLHAHANPAAPLSRSSSCIALFDHTPDHALAHAGPWLLDATDPAGPDRATLKRLGCSGDGCIWLISTHSFADLADALRARLDVRLPSGATALLRYYDARISEQILAVLLITQRAEFFGPVRQWLSQCQGRLTRIYPTHAD